MVIYGVVQVYCYIGQIVGRLFGLVVIVGKGCVLGVVLQGQDEFVGRFWQVFQVVYVDEQLVVVLVVGEWDGVNVYVCCVVLGCCCWNYGYVDLMFYYVVDVVEVVQLYVVL